MRKLKLVVILTAIFLLGLYQSFLALFNATPGSPNYSNIYRVGVTVNIQLLDFLSVDLLTDPDICTLRDGSVAQTVIVVHSHPSHANLRTTTRKYFPSSLLQDMKMKRVFVLGLARNGQAKYPDVAQAEIEEEYFKYKDIVQGNFDEHYRNLTYKHILSLEWFQLFCPQASVIIKVDDDSAVDIIQINKILPTILKSGGKKMFGHVFSGISPIRNKLRKTFATRQEFFGGVLAVLLCGWGGGGGG